MRSLRLIADRKLELADVAAPPPPGKGEVQIRIKAVALNHLDVWGFRGMAFAKRKLPLVVGAEASGEIAEVGAGIIGVAPGDIGDVRVSTQKTVDVEVGNIPMSPRRAP